MKPTKPRFLPWSERNTKRQWTPPSDERSLSELAADGSGLVRLDYGRNAFVEFGGRKGMEVHPTAFLGWPVFRDGLWCWHTNPDGHRAWTHKPETASQRGDVSRKWTGPLGATVHGYHGTRLFVLTCPELGYRQRECGSFAGTDLVHATPEEIAAALVEATSMLKAEATMAVNRLRDGLRKLR